MILCMTWQTLTAEYWMSNSDRNILWETLKYTLHGIVKVRTSMSHFLHFGDLGDSIQLTPLSYTLIKLTFTVPLKIFEM